MSNLIGLLEIKKHRASIVVDKIVKHCEALKDSSVKEDVVIGKKINRLVQGMTKKTASEKDNIEYLRHFFDYHKKISNKIHEIDSNFQFFDEDVAWVNEIKPIVVFDVDDTLRDATHRYSIREDIENMKEELAMATETVDTDDMARIRSLIDARWQDFFIAGFDDTPKQDVIDLCNMYYDLGFEVRIRTGASALYQDRTEQHLKDMGVKYHELRMRKEGVRIPDYRLKPAWISKYDLGENVFAIYDDRIPLIQGFKSKGVVNTVLVDKSFDAKKHLEEIQPLIDKQLEIFQLLDSNEKNID